MITNLRIRGFKSIHNLDVDCRRINFFVGAPSVGKSNLLESLGLFSWASFDLGGDLRDYVRHKLLTNLFRDNDVHEEIRVGCDSLSFQIEFKSGRFHGVISDNQDGELASFDADYNRVYSISTGARLASLRKFRFYRFQRLTVFDRPESDSLIPPAGRNLTSLLLGNRELRAAIGDLFSSTGAKLGIRPDEHTLELTREADDILISYPLVTASDTLIRMAYYVSALLSNSDAIITLEEPESHVFPYYSKQLSEMMVNDNRGNQFFVTTHNPYLLVPTIFKASKDDVAVNVTYLKDGYTAARRLSDAELSELGEIDLFSNLDRYLSGK